MAQDFTSNVVAGICIIGGSALFGSAIPGSALAQDASAKIESLADKVAAARESANSDATLKHVQANCSLAWSDIKYLRKEYPDEDAVWEATRLASEACDFEVPVAFFESRLEPATCEVFFGEVGAYFEHYRGFALGWYFGDGTPEQQEIWGTVDSRFKEAMSESVNSVCNTTAAENGY